MGNSSKKTSSSHNTVYGKTTTSNPFVVSKTNNKGTLSSFAKGSAYDTLNKFVNNNVGAVLDGYLNPTLDSVANKSKFDSYKNALSNSARASFENDVINPLSTRNMIRSSQATNMYKNLSNNLSNNLANYANELLANSRTESESMLKTLLGAYMDSFNVINANQNTSLSTSKGNAAMNSQSTSSMPLGIGDYSRITGQMLNGSYF